ncbi:MAG TPA: glycosyltransferase family 2 protein [Egibacteraceae bacterium]|nr:glycosyltransferase family 2 protein [Egibacteraceae bacterium]
MTASVAIVIVNWNTGRYLQACLEAVAKADADGYRLASVCVVDNASRDASLRGVESMPLPLTVIRNPDNRGFAAACNQGAAATSSEYLLFLNPDTRVYSDALARAVAFMESDAAADVGICGAQMVDAAGARIPCCSRFPTVRVLLGRMTGLNRLVPALFPAQELSLAETARSRPVDQVIGAFLLVRRPLFEALGGFDERFFLYFEEVDLCYRARAKGFQSYLVTEALAFHEGQVSSKQVRAERLFQGLRSRSEFLHQHWPPWRAYLIDVLTLVVELPMRCAVGLASRRPGRVSETTRASAAFCTYVMSRRTLIRSEHASSEARVP